VDKGRQTLVLLTQSYPFGRKSETFLDAELPVLARSFTNVIVVPSNREAHVRKLPTGVRCETFLADASQKDAQRELLRQLRRSALQYGRALADEGSAKAYVCHPRTYIGSIGRNAVKYKLLRDFVRRESLQSAVFYDYWLENSTLALSWLRREGHIDRAVARAHGFDLYDHRWPSGTVPFRSFKLAALDRVFPISSHGLAYLARKHPTARSKLSLCRLGVEAQQVGLQTREAEPLVVSCASLHPTKRVEMLPSVLARIGRPLRWVHFGDGPSMVEVERAARMLPARVAWRLDGHVDHSELIDFYRTNRVDLFVSLSACEGLPVSIMEAISFGVPVLATGVDGVPEIVNASTGRLVDVDDSPDAIAAEARPLLDGDGPSREEVIGFFETNFEAGKNFGAFAAMLHAV
jgi:glycosyltransferase involved in cell wall biosynthesis